MPSPTVRTLDKLRKEGYIAAVVERFIGNGRFGFRKDLYGIIDIVGIKEGVIGVLGVQTTTGDHLQDHMRKILDNDEIKKNLETWIKSGNRFHLHGWRKGGPRNKKKIWQCRTKEVALNDLR